ncbi:MAG: hypothetical protein WBW52_09245 [Desulfobaccales bacterium]
MKKVNVIEANDFSETGMKKLLVHDSPYFKILTSISKLARNSRSMPTTSRDR